MGVAVSLLCCSGREQSCEAEEDGVMMSVQTPERKRLSERAICPAGGERGR